MSMNSAFKRRSLGARRFLSRPSNSARASSRALGLRLTRPSRRVQDAEGGFLAQGVDLCPSAEKARWT